MDDTPREASPAATPASGADAAGAGARLTIGALSRATGIPVETLRTWESRYGFPEPERKPSGHRLYPASVVPRLRRIAYALARGHRASQVVTASEAALSALLEASAAAHGGPSERVSPVASAGNGLGELLSAVSTYDADRLTRALLDDWARLGLVDFLEQKVGPLVRQVGEEWSAGTMQVRHEHFLAERVGDVLRTLRLPFERRAAGPLTIFATLPGELHGLGLQMAALAVVAAGCQALYLGTDVPTEQIADLAGERDARAVAISMSRCSAVPSASAELHRLRDLLPRSVHLLVGGEGAPRGARAETVADFAELQTWASALARH